jgi:hypothetical protein
MGDGAAPASFACTELIGLLIASRWWPTFDKDINAPAKWQFMFQWMGEVELFADPTNAYWNNAVATPCPGAKPDRVVFLPHSLTLTTLADFQAALTKLIPTIQGKFPGVKRIELITTVRTPGNMPCNGVGTVVPAYVDQAIQNVADASSGLVTVGPKAEVQSCAWFAAMDDLTAAGYAGIGKLYADYYNTH